MTAVPEFERRFYLEQFTGRTLVIGTVDRTDLDVVETCAAELVAAGVQVVLLVGGGPAGEGGPWRPDDEGTVAVWRQLRRDRLVRLDLAADALPTAVDLGARLRAFKLVLLDPAQPRPEQERPDSYVTLGDADAQAGGARGLAVRALTGGVSTVNLCHPADVAEELLTYAGAGTCFTMGDWTRVERLGIDDFPQVAELIHRGVEEGYLKARDDDAIARLVVNGYGAVVGDHHLAGFASLLTEPYAADRVGEVCALSTISRFGGGGVGATLVRAILDDAAAQGLAGVFACTAVDAAARFFARLGFTEVPQDRIPAAKWAGYDPVRQPSVRAFLHGLGG